MCNLQIRMVPHEIQFKTSRINIPIYIYIYTLVTIIFNVSQKNLLKKNKIARHRYSHMLRVRFLELRKKVI